MPVWVEFDKNNNLLWSSDVHIELLLAPGSVFCLAYPPKQVELGQTYSRKNLNYLKIQGKKHLTSSQEHGRNLDLTNMPSIPSANSQLKQCPKQLAKIPPFLLSDVPQFPAQIGRNTYAEDALLSNIYFLKNKFPSTRFTHKFSRGFSDQRHIMLFHRTGTNGTGSRTLYNAIPC